MSLYETLGVPDDADADTIRAAHRRLVRKHHPDAGGNREEFEKVQHAYLILRDPKTRARYDETGETEVAPDNELSEIATIIVGCFDEATGACGGRFDQVDLIADMRRAIARRLHAARENLANLESGVAIIEKLIKRLSYKGDRRDVIGAMLESRLADNRRAQAAVNAEIENIERAQEYAKDYGYAFDPVPAFSPYAAQQAAFDQSQRGGPFPNWFNR